MKILVRILLILAVTSYAIAGEEPRESQHSAEGYESQKDGLVFW